MTIRRVETMLVRVPLLPERRMISALGRHDVSQYCLVRITDSSGEQGLGEATVTPRWSGETARGAQAIIDELFAPALLGLDPDAIDEIDHRLESLAVGNWFAKAALEMACWDVVGKKRKLPVYALLGGPVRDRTVRCRFSLGAYEPARAAEIAARCVAEGFTTIKVKVGGPLEDDVQRVRAVRDAIGPDVELTIDANGGWDVETAVAAARQMEPLEISLIEQPTPRDDLPALAEVRRRTGLPIMADESCFNLTDARELVRHRACDAISIYPGKQGGIRRALRIASFAEEHGIACTVGSNLELDVATSAMGQMVLAHRNLRVEQYPGDMLGPVYHERRIVRRPLTIQGPHVTVPDAAGLGVELDAEAIDAIRLTP